MIEYTNECGKQNNELNWVNEWLNGSDLNFLVFTAL